MKSRHNLKKMLSVLMVLAMTITTLTLIPLTASATTPAAWDGTTVDTSWVDAKSGADWDNAYEIADGADLAGWSQLSHANPTRFDGKYFKLTADINMGGNLEEATNLFTPLVAGIYDSGDSGVHNCAIHFDGQDHTISNLAINYGKTKATTGGTTVASLNVGGLFLTLGDNSVIKNVHFENYDIIGPDSGTGCTAFIAAYGSFENCEFSNISIDANSTLTGGAIMGAIIGGACDTRQETSTDVDVTVFRYIVNEGTITQAKGGAGRTGGFIGSWQTPTDLDFDYCAQKGSVTYTSTGGTTGAFVGTCMDGAKGVQNVSFKNCYNLGTLSVPNDNTARVSSTVADFGYGAACTLTVENFYDFGVKEVPDNFTGTLMVAGSTSNKSVTVEVTLKNCYAAPKTGTNTTSADGKGDYAAFKNDFTQTASVALVAYALTSNNSAATPSDNSFMVASVSSAIVTDVANNTTSTITAEIQRIDAAIAAKTPVTDEGGAANQNPYLSGWGAETLDYSWYYTAGALVDKGTEAAPYEIASGAQLAALSALSNGVYTVASVGETGTATAKDFNGKYFKLTADIDLQSKAFLPIAVGTIVLDGNNKTISNLKVDGELLAGLFAMVGRGTEIKNLKFVGADINAKSNGAVLIATALNDLTIYNVQIDETSAVVSVGQAAGFVAAAADRSAVTENDPEEIKITYSINKAAITGKGKVSGFIANYDGYGNITVAYCLNEGSMTSTSTTGWQDMGAFLARSQDLGAGMQNSFTFANCINKGAMNINLTEGDNNSYIMSGGIIGCTWNTGSDIIVENCFDYCVRNIQTTGRAASIASIYGSSKMELIKDMIGCYSAPADGTVTPSTNVFLGGVDSNYTPVASANVATLTSPIINQFGNSSTMAAEMEKIMTAIANLSEIEEEEPTVPPTTGGDDEGGAGGGTNDTTKPADDTTTEAPAEEKKGCKSSVSAMYAVLALTAIVGCAFVAKRKEEN